MITASNTEQQIAVALQLHTLCADKGAGVGEVATPSQRPGPGQGRLAGDGFVVMFSDLLAALSCLLTEQKLTQKLIEERPSRPNWTAEDWIASELGDSKMDQGTTHKKAMARQLESAERMRQKVGRGLVRQTRLSSDRACRTNVTVIEWDPETRLHNKPGP